MPPSIWPAGAQGGTSACRSGAALSFVSCIRLFGGVVAPVPMWPTLLILAPRQSRPDSKPDGGVAPGIDHVHEAADCGPTNRATGRRLAGERGDVQRVAGSPTVGSDASIREQLSCDKYYAGNGHDCRYCQAYTASESVADHEHHCDDRDASDAARDQ